MNLKVGDKVLKILPPSENWWAFVNDGEVTKVTEAEVTCLILVDGPRTMKFSPKTGMCLAGTGNFIIYNPTQG